MIAQGMIGSKGKQTAPDTSTMAVYLGAFASGALVWQSFHDLGLSTFITLAVAIQCFGYACLRLKISQQRSVAGISAQTLILQAASCALRLTSTTWLQGYIPVDGTGDWLYQAVDALSLVILLNILHCIFKTYRTTYQEEHDNIKVEYIGLSCFVLAVLVHPDLNNRPVFDTFWTTALYMDVVAMAPQLVLISKIRGEIEALTAHFVSATALSRLTSLIFWYHGFAELAPLDGSFNLAGWAIIAAHVLQVLLLGDFLFYYIRALVKTGSASFTLPTYAVDV
jgi:hypothetical protein